MAARAASPRCGIDRFGGIDEQSAWRLTNGSGHVHTCLVTCLQIVPASDASEPTDSPMTAQGIEYSGHDRIRSNNASEAQKEASKQWAQIVCSKSKLAQSGTFAHPNRRTANLIVLACDSVWHRSVVDFLE